MIDLYSEVNNLFIHSEYFWNLSNPMNTTVYYCIETHYILV